MAGVFGCCGAYKDCSIAGRCIHGAETDYAGCQYRKNLEAGRIFYKPPSATGILVKIGSNVFATVHTAEGNWGVTRTDMDIGNVAVRHMTQAEIEDILHPVQHVPPITLSPTVTPIKRLKGYMEGQISVFDLVRGDKSLV